MAPEMFVEVSSFGQESEPGKASVYAHGHTC